MFRFAASDAALKRRSSTVVYRSSFLGELCGARFPSIALGVDSRRRLSLHELLFLDTSIFPERFVIRDAGSTPAQKNMRGAPRTKASGATQAGATEARCGATLGRRG